MAGAYDVLRRIPLMAAAAATFVFVMAPAARADDPSAAVAAATGAAIAEQAQPANVNVSVRVDSPGENGPVAQANSAGASAAVPRRVLPTSTSRCVSTAPVTTAR